MKLSKNQLGASVSIAFAVLAMLPFAARILWTWGLWLLPISMCVWTMGVLAVIAIRAPHRFALTAGVGFVVVGLGFVVGPILVDSQAQLQGRDSRCIYDIPSTEEGVPLPMDQWDFPSIKTENGEVSVPWVLDCWDTDKTPTFVRLLEPIGSGLIAAGLVQLILAVAPKSKVE